MTEQRKIPLVISCNLCRQHLQNTKRQVGLKICLYGEAEESKDSVRDITGWGKDYAGGTEGGRGKMEG